MLQPCCSRRQLVFHMLHWLGVVTPPRCPKSLGAALKAVLWQNHLPECTEMSMPAAFSRLLDALGTGCTVRNSFWRSMLNFRGSLCLDPGALHLQRGWQPQRTELPTGGRQPAPRIRRDFVGTTLCKVVHFHSVLLALLLEVRVREALHQVAPWCSWLAVAADFARATEPYLPCHIFPVKGLQSEHLRDGELRRLWSHSLRLSTAGWPMAAFSKLRPPLACPAARRWPAPQLAGIVVHENHQKHFTELSSTFSSANTSSGPSSPAGLGDIGESMAIACHSRVCGKGRDLRLGMPKTSKARRPFSFSLSWQSPLIRSH